MCSAFRTMRLGLKVGHLGGNVSGRGEDIIVTVG